MRFALFSQPSQLQSNSKTVKPSSAFYLWSKWCARTAFCTKEVCKYAFSAPINTHFIPYRQYNSILMSRHNRRRKLLSPFKRFYLRTTGYSYTNMGRLFLRLFVGFMLLQFGIRQLLSFDQMQATFPSVFGLTSADSLILMTIIEIGCSFFIMIGMFTRIMCIPPFLSMAIAEYYLLSDSLSPASYELSWQQLGYLPVMFMGIYFFIILVGPGKISIDYVLSLHIIHTEDCNEDDELEQV